MRLPTSSHRGSTDRQISMTQARSTLTSDGKTKRTQHHGWLWSFAREIYRFDYNEEGGTISNQSVFATFDEADGLPDGATIDCEGHLWSALWDGGCVVRLSKKGGIAEALYVPVVKIASLTFGDKNFTTLFISTAGGNEKESEEPLNQIDLNERHAVITGGAQGIGLSIATRLIASGASVSLWDRDAELLKAAQEQLAGKGEVSTETVDVSDPTPV
jgi:hypothetical protein